MNPNNPFNKSGYRPRPNNQPDLSDPNILNNPAFYNMINHMNVAPQMGFVNWSAPNEAYVFGSPVQHNTPAHYFDRQRVVNTPPPTPNSPDVEFVPETQFEAGGSNQKGKSRQKRKTANEKVGRSKAIAWTTDEELSLAKAWLDVTEDPDEANYQKDRVYWRRICDKFLSIEKKDESFRDPDKLSSKWRKMRPHIQAFNQIYTRRTRSNNHQSGENDADVIKNSLKEYQGIYEKPFTFLPIWDKIRHSSKFHLVAEFDVRTTRGVPSSKRSKTSSSNEPQSQGSDARVNIDLNAFEEDDEEPVFQERPRGRDAARRASKADKGKGKYAETFASLSGKLDGLMNISNERLDLGKEKMEMEKAKQSDRKNAIKLAELRVLTTDYSHLNEPEKSIMLKAQEDIKTKYAM